MVSLKRGNKNYGKIVRARNEDEALMIAKDQFTGFKIITITQWGTSVFASL
jgi:hypothetical protein